MHISLRTLLPALALSLLFASPLEQPARAADPKTEARSLGQAAGEAVKNRDFARAIELLERAVQLDPHRDVRWNLARSYQFRGQQLAEEGDVDGAKAHLESARQRFDELARVSAKDVVSAREQIAQIDLLVAELSKSVEPVEEPSPPEPIVTPVAPEPQPDTMPEPMVHAAPESGSTLLVPAAITTGTGVLLAAAGIYFLLDAGDLRSSVRDAADESGFIASMTQTRARSIEGEADTSELLGVMGVALGSAALVTGTVLFFLDGPPKSSQSTTVSLLPTSHGTTLFVQGSF